VPAFSILTAASVGGRDAQTIVDGARLLDTFVITPRLSRGKSSRAMTRIVVKKFRSRNENSQHNKQSSAGRLVPLCRIHLSSNDVLDPQDDCNAGVTQPARTSLRTWHVIAGGRNWFGGVFVIFRTINWTTFIHGHIKINLPHAPTYIHSSTPPLKAALGTPNTSLQHEEYAAYWPDTLSVSISMTLWPDRAT